MSLQTLSMQDSDCPVIKRAEELSGESKSLRATINKLRREMRACDVCPEMGTCAALVKLNEQIEAAIDALMAEWNLS